ncbi:M3 family oligoendopeptidase [uncultured Abiotrophia sp.]|uniref:M3 family oligoendopeptidase n=1 Tax=uncultured Abiotrophia sp. TaxID=316094 RepID=UPI0028D4954E|nr:M3 family oligoendopeptidase [uncultured Abiotrophia sp.]
MKFSELEYQRPDLDLLKEDFFNQISLIEMAEEAEVALKATKHIQEIQNTLGTLSTLVSIRNSINTKDSFYEEETAFWDEHFPIIGEWDTAYYRAVLGSKWRSELENYLPETFFPMAENSLKVFSPEIIPLLQQENKLSTEYSKLQASAEIEFQGQTYNLPGMAKFAQDPDREVRRQASELVSAFYNEHEAEFDRIYDQLVKVRDQIAKTLGFKDFVEVGYLRMNRLDYNRQQVEVYRQEILEHVVPVVNKLYQRQADRLGLESLKPYDLEYKFQSGNAMPQGTPEEILAAGVKMYHELSPETGEFIDFMVDRELLDLVTKPGKASGGYCTYLPDYEAPFIFSNFNGTAADVDVLTHEAGHAFQVFQSRWIQTPECVWPTFESCEIHSMSMEFLAWPWMELFFGSQTLKYKFTHLSGGLIFLPYGVLVDHFQHEVYEHPEMTPAERRATWRRLERQYVPWKEYEADSFLDRGGFWFRQGHIFASPFYYIDYTLAQVCAFQFWKRSQIDDDPSVWTDYLNICRTGGTKSFLKIVAEANLKSPFEPGSLVETVQAIEQYLDDIPESAFQA